MYDDTIACTSGGRNGPDLGVLSRLPVRSFAQGGRHGLMGNRL